MKPLRVLQFGMTPNPGGIESFIMNYYRRIDRKRINFDFVSMYNEIAYADEIEALGGAIYKITHFKNNPYKNYKELKVLMEKNNYQIVHINMLSAAYIIPLIVTKKFGVKCIIIHSHNSSTPPGIIRKLLNVVNKKLLTNATHFFACSGNAAEWMFGSKNKEKANIINNAIAADKYSYNPEVRRKVSKELGIEGKFVIGHVGRFEFQKNHDFLIKVFYEVLNIHPNSQLLLIGDGIEKDNIQKKIVELGISDSVKFLGLRSDISELMQAMDIFVLPSHFEGLGTVLIEAQAAGLKCIASDGVAQEAKITNLVEFINLDESPKYWARKIVEYQPDFNRRDTYEEIKKAKFDVNTEILILEDIYINSIK